MALDVFAQCQNSLSNQKAKATHKKYANVIFLLLVVFIEVSPKAFLRINLVQLDETDKIVCVFFVVVVVVVVLRLRNMFWQTLITKFLKTN